MTAGTGDHCPDRRRWLQRCSGLWPLSGGWCWSSDAAATPRRHAPAHAAADLQLWGYYPWWMREEWQRRRIGLYHRLSLFELEIGEDGQLLDTRGWPARWQPLGTALRAGGGRLDITLFLSQAERFERVFGSPERHERLLAQVLALARQADGVNLDVEVYAPLSAGARRGYAAFCTALAVGLHGDPGGPSARHAERKSLSVFGMMGAVVNLYERPILPLIDHVVVQGYDSHHADSHRAGPVAPLRGPDALTWERALRHYLALGWPRHKLIFGLPFYGYEWATETAEARSATLAPGRQISYAAVDERLLPQIRVSARAEVQRHGLRRDAASGSPYYVYRDDGGRWRQGWFEDETSLAAKLAFVRDEGLAGAAVFPVGYDDGAFDALLQRAFRGS